MDLELPQPSNFGCVNKNVVKEEKFICGILGTANLNHLALLDKETGWLNKTCFVQTQHLGLFVNHLAVLLSSNFSIDFVGDFIRLLQSLL